MDSLTNYMSGISTAPALASAMPGSILLDTTAPPANANPYIYSSSTSAPTSTHAFSTITTAADQTTIPASSTPTTSFPAASYYAANGSVVTTTLPISRLATTVTSSVIGTGGYLGGNSSVTGSMAPVAPFNAAATNSMTKHGLFVALLAVAAVLL